MGRAAFKAEIEAESARRLELDGGAELRPALIRVGQGDFGQNGAIGAARADGKPPGGFAAQRDTKLREARREVKGGI